jgi:lysyl-tRNA synthetase class I
VPTSGERWQAAIFAVAAGHGLDAKAAFNALYLAFLGRPNGPRAGWLLASLEHDFVIRRLIEAGATTSGEATA